MGWYQIHDYWTTSPVEGVRNAYRNAIDAIDNYLATIHSVMEWMPDQVNQLIGTFQGRSVLDQSQGAFVREFESKASVVEREMHNLYGRSGTLGSAEALLRSKKTELERRLRILNKLCAREDKEENELPLSAIYF